MAEKIKIDLEVIDNVEASIGNLRALKRELRNVAAGSEEFNIIKGKINDIEDALKSAKTGADNFVEIVGALPGPVGELGDKVGGTLNVLKQFGGIKLDALKNSFTELGKDVGDVFKGFGNLTGLTKAYESSVKGLTRAMTSLGIAEETAATGARILAAATGAIAVTALIAGIMELYEVTKEWITGEKAAKEAADDFNSSLEIQKGLYNDIKSAASRSNAERIARLKSEGASESHIRKQQEQDALKDYQAAFNNRRAIQKEFLKNSKDLSVEEFKKAAAALKEAQNNEKDLRSKYNVLILDNQTAANKELKTKQDEANRKSEQASEQSAAKRLAIRKAEQDELLKGQKDAFIQTLSEKEQEQYKINEKYSELLYLATKYGQDTTNIKIAQKNELAEVDAKWAKKELDDQKDLDEKKKKANKDAFEQAKSQLDLQKAEKLISEDEYQKRLQDLSIKYAETEADRINAQVAYLNYVDDAKEKALAKDKERAKEQQEINRQITQSWIDLGTNIGNTFQQLAGLFEKGSDAAKAFGVISVIINAAAAIGKVNMDFAKAISTQSELISAASATVQEGILLSTNPFTAAQGIAMIAAGSGVGATATAQLGVMRANKALQIASIGITSGAQIAAILSASRSSSVTQSSSAGAAGSPSPAYSGGAPAMAAPQLTTQPSSTPGAQIAESLSQSSGRPIRAYVVSSDISSQQAMDRKVNKGATFAMG